MLTLSPFISLGSCNNCNLACFLWVILNILSRTMGHGSSVHNNLYTLWLEFWYSNNFQVSTTSPKISKAVSPFEVSTQYCSLPYTSFRFLNWTSPYETCTLFVYSLSVPPWFLLPPDTGQRHSQLPWKIGHLVSVYQYYVSCIVPQYASIEMKLLNVSAEIWFNKWVLENWYTISCEVIVIAELITLRCWTSIPKLI
jgi:hypothetical protein